MLLIQVYKRKQPLPFNSIKGIIRRYTDYIASVRKLKDGRWMQLITETSPCAKELLRWMENETGKPMRDLSIHLIHNARKTPSFRAGI